MVFNRKYSHSKRLASSSHLTQENHIQLNTFQIYNINNGLNNNIFEDKLETFNYKTKTRQLLTNY